MTRGDWHELAFNVAIGGYWLFVLYLVVKGKAWRNF